jgi:hypothetical protein
MTTVAQQAGSGTTAIRPFPHLSVPGSLAGIPIWGTIFEGKPFARQ